MEGASVAPKLADNGLHTQSRQAWKHFRTELKPSGHLISCSPASTAVSGVESWASQARKSL